MEHTLIIGLGNPDPLLANTYHNVGVLAVEELAQTSAENGEAAEFRHYKNIFSYAKVGGRTFVRPLVFMNESGIAAKEAMHMFNARPENIVVIHDDSDITIGEVKYSNGGGSAGHNGIRSIIDHIKTNDFARIRIGIREKDEIHRRKAEEFVLSPISSKNQKIFDHVFGSLKLDD